jgi:transcriptional regulator of acetoin/glycerol metabolism
VAALAAQRRRHGEHRPAARQPRRPARPARPGRGTGAVPARRREQAERQALVTALREAGWNREAAARDLGISRATIYRKLKRLKVTAPARGGPAAKEGTQ